MDLLFFALWGPRLVFHASLFFGVCAPSPVFSCFILPTQLLLRRLWWVPRMVVVGFGGRCASLAGCVHGYSQK